jgi:MoxR-like ATPase
MFESSDVATPEAAAEVRAVANALVAEIAKHLYGKQDALRLTLACLLGGGHLLIEDVPGTGKTSLAKALAGCIGGSSHRVQFTPDLLPGDITGVSVWDQQKQAFEFRPGPVFANVVVADEINRASPKTQSALLEVMQEAQVSVDGVPHRVPTPFLVVATQNPIDLEGTYRLPEAQLDRFLMRISLGYPDLEVEEAILTGRARMEPPSLRSITSVDQIVRLQHIVSTVHVAPEIVRYIALIAQTTRAHNALRLGVSTRGSLALLRAAQAYACCTGRNYVVPDDVKSTATAVLAHRLVLTAKADVRGTTAESVLAEVLGSMPLPTLMPA